MKYSFNWLKELSGTKSSPEQVVDDLTMHSMEVEGLEKIGSDFDKVVVGEILDIKKHPNADRLQIVTVNAGPSLLNSLPKGEKESMNILHIVCGAHNIKVGDKVPVALVGAILPGNFEIKAAEIRGEKSFGMLCAEDELGLGKDHSGIIILDPKANIGAPASQYLGGSDSLLEIKVLPDRAHDAMSHVGVAREICVLERRNFDYDFDGLVLPRKKSKILSVKIEETKLCPRYIGAVMTNVEIKDSPEWMQARLKACGIKAINNVVDATNYVMLELGQPLHAFDAEKLVTQNVERGTQSTLHAPRSTFYEIVVRRAKDKEKIILLDDSAIELNNSDLLITNGETPLALAGIMGGKDSGISGDTKAIVLEAANFNATNIRKTRTRLNVKTESSDRFEKDIDPNLAEKAMVRIIEILEHTANAKLEGIADIYPNKIKPWKIKLNLDYVNRLLGEDVPEKEVIKVLNLLGIEAQALGAGKPVKGKGNGLLEPGTELNCTIPTFRIDIKTQENLIEEIGRVWGYEKIKSQPLKENVEPIHIDERVFFERRLKDVLTAMGSSEMYNYSSYSENDANRSGLGEVEHLQLANPMNPDQALVRVRLIPNILKNIRENSKHFSVLNIFELGRTYFPEKNGIKEYRLLAWALVLEKDKNAETFFALKGQLEDLFGILGVKDVEFSVPDESLKLWHPSRTAIIKSKDILLGKIGEISPQILNAYKISSRVALAELDINELFKVVSSEKTYQPISKFPIVIRDISLISPKKVTVSEITKAIKQSGGGLVKDVELFDVFKKEEKNSFAFHISFGSSERTLESKEVDKLMGDIVSAFERELKIEVRK